jgi:hypothetical protein
MIHYRLHCRGTAEYCSYYSDTRGVTVPLSVIKPTLTRITRAVLRACTLIPLAGLVARRGLGAPAQMARPKMDRNLGR